MSTSAIDVSTLDRQGTVLAWSQTILENYSQLSLLPPIQSLDDQAWHNGLGFLCLSHCFFPDSVPDFLNAVREPDFRSFDIFKAELNIQPPALPLNPDTITAYLSDIRNAIDARGEELVQRLKMTQAQLKTETYQIRITRRTREKTVEDEEFERRATLVLNKISQLRTQLNDMTLMATAASSSSRQTQESPSKEAPEDDLATRMQAFEEQLSILNSHDRVELETYVQQMPENSSAVAARMQAIDAAYSVLQLQLQEDFEAIRENVLFSELTTPIRDELEYIQAKMLKTATSEESISDLETRAEHAGKLLDDIAQQHHHTLLESGKPYCSQFDALRQKHRLICSWVNDVRVWFTEAEKLRHWMEERIKEINAESLPDALDEEIECSQQDIEEWMRRHEALEKQLEIFDKEDMTRLRAHVKALTGSERRDDKDLSPADTTTIEITFTTLMVLDKLLHRVRQRSYNLQMLNLRSVWEQEHKISAEWVMDAEMQVSDILHRAQWKKDEEKTRTGDDAEKYKNAIVQDLLDLEQRVAEFDQGQFTTMVNMYQEIDDTSKVELPAYLESRQVAVEEALEELSKRLAFVRQVVEQRLSVQNFVYLADALKVVGEQLRHELTIAEETAAPDDTDFTARVRSYQEDAVELITNVSSHLRYPHASHLKDEASTEEANETARNAVGARTSYLILFAETLDHHLKSYRNVLELKQRADQLQDDINALNNWTESKLLSLSKTPVDVLAKDNLPDLQRLQSLEKETEVLAGHAKSARKDRLDMLRNELQILTTSVKTSNATAVKTDVLKENLQQLAHKVDTYNDRLSERAVHIDLMKLRHAWNKEYSAATQALNMAIQEAWNTISRLQWSQANISDQDDQVKSLLEYVMKARDNIKAQDLEAVSKAFAAFKENIAEKLPGVDIPDYMIQHQTGLDKLLQTLDTIIEYAHAVAEQRSAIEQFNGKVQHLLERGQALMKQCETATDNVMSSKENDRKVAKDVDVLVQQFEEDVDTLWTLVDNEIPYPVCPKDAWETRPYIYGNKEAYDANEGVRQYISEQREHLSALIMQLRTLSDQHSQAAQLADTVHQILKEIQDTNAKISNLSTSIKSDRPDLLAAELPLSPAPDSNAELQKRAALYEEDIDKLDLPGIRAKCHEVEQSISNFRNKAIDPSIMTTALATLENRASELSQLTKEHKRYLEAFESRIKWEQVHKQASKTADEAQSKLRAVSDELDIFISKDLELVGKEKAYIEELGDQVDQESKPLLSALSQELIPSLRKAYQDMNEQYQGLDTSLPGTLEECQNELLALEPALIEKEQGLQEKLKQLLLRIEWQHAAQQASKRSLDIEQDIEAFINNEARWIPGKTAATKQKDLEPRQKQLQDIVKSHSDTVFKLLESRDQMLLNSTVLETISNKMTEKTEVLKAKIEQLEAHLVFAGQVIQQHVAINEYLDQATMLDEEADKLHKELAASNALDPDEISRFKQKVDDFCNQPAVPCPVRDHDPRYNSLDKSANASVSETVAARQAKLKELVVSLEMASKAKEEAKAAVDSYLQDAQTVQGWIQPRLDQVQKIISQLPSNNSDPDILGESLTAIKAIRSAIQAYGGAFASLKRKSEALLEESKPEVQETQEQVSRLWQELLGHSENAEKRLESSLHAAEFKQQVDEFGKELIALQEQLKSADISTVTDEQIAGWRKQVQNLKVRRVDAIASQCKTEGDKVECRRIQQEHAQLKDALQDLVSQVHQDRLHKEYHSRTESVKAFANNILAQLGKLRSQYLDVAADEEDHRSKAQEFVDAYHDIKQIVKKESTQLVEEQRSFYRFLQHQGVQLQETQTRCDDLVNDMQQKLADTGVATQIVTQWHTLHMNLNNLSRDMDGVANSIQESAEVSSLEEQTSTLTSLAERLETTRQSAEKLVAAPQGSTKATVDAFYAHHGEIEKQLKRLEQVAAEKQQEIEKQRALQENLDAIKAIKESAQQESIAIREYIETLGDSLTNGQTDAVESQYRQAVARHHASDEKYQELSAALEAKADDGLKDTDAYKETSNALSELKGSIEMEKSTHDYLRRMVGHVKSANSVMLWIQNCRNAMDNLETQMNLAEDRDINTEIDDIAQRMQDFDRFLRSFNSMTDALLETEDINGKLKHAVKTRTASIWSAWEELERQLEDLKVAANKMTQGVAIVRQVKAIMTKLGETRDQISSIRLPDNEPDESPSSPLPTQHMALSDLLREPDALAAEKALSGIESGARSQLDAEVQRLDNLLGEYGESNSSFEQQRAEVDAAVANLYGAIAEKRKQVALALAVGRCLSTTDDTEILLSALEEAVNKAAPHRASIIGGNFSKTDVQTRYIELDARYKYYEQKIVESLDAAQVAAEDIADCPQKRRVLKHIEQLQERAEKVDRLAKSRRDELVKVLESAADPQPVITSRIRKSSLPTRKASQFLREREKSPSKLLSSINDNNSNSSSSSNNSSSNSPKPSTSLPRPSPRYLSANQLQNRTPRLNQQLTVPGERPQLRQPSKSASNLKQPSIKVSRPPPPNKYVADPDNDLDMEIGRIVNETPYKVKVKMVPGEVGRYWFGDVNPKLAYCRVLKSKMVMVRVGGGWMELSEFLRDHALLEGDFIPKARATEAPPTIQEGFIETEQRRRARSPNPPSLITAANINASRSAPQNNNQQQHLLPTTTTMMRPTGYMDGDRYIAVDKYGNELEVKMTRAGSRDYSDSRSSSISHRRRRVPRRHPTSSQ